MSFGNVLRLYRARMGARSVAIQELFAVLGIAVGVALLFSSQVASTSLTHSVGRLTQAVVGDTQLQIDARGPRGFGESLLARTRGVAGVRSAFSVLEQQAVVIGPHGAGSVELLGVDPSAVHLGGPLLRRLSAHQLALGHAVALPTPIAHAIGAGPLEDVGLQIRGASTQALLGAVLGLGAIGALANGEIVLAPVAYAQRLAGMEGRISRIFVRTAPGRTALVSARLEPIAAAAGANVQPAGFDSTLFSVASSGENQGETVFSAISALVGLMFALNAMLVTAPARRRLVESIHPQGATRAAILQILLLDALLIGAAACVLGLALGDLFSVTAFRSTPGYLSSAFPVGNERIVTLQSVLLACLAGLVAACVGVVWPLRDIFARAPAQAEASIGHGATHARARVSTGLGCLVVTTVVLVAHNQSWLVGLVALMVALVCLLPSLFELTVFLFDRLRARLLDGAAPMLAVCELRNPRTRVRSLAVALTGAIAVFGAVAIGGAQANLRDGLRGAVRDIDGGASVWIAPAGQNSLLTTTPFRARAVNVRALARAGGVASVGVYRGSFLDWGDRRLWVQAPSANATYALPPNQLLSAGLALAQARLRAGGWAAVSQALASEHHLVVGSRFVLPSPTPTLMRVAALTTNLGWPPGAIVLSSADYARAWGSPEPSAYEIQTRPGFQPAVVRRAVARTLSPGSGLVVETVGERRARHYALADQGLARFTQLKLLVLIAGALAIAGAIGSLIYQRRELMAFMKVDGYRRAVLWRWLLCESLVMLLAGCVTGSLFGLYGQLLISHALATVTGLPIALGAETAIALTSVVSVSALVSAIVALPGYLAVRVPASTVGAAY